MDYDRSMDVEQFKEDVRCGRIDADRLVELIVKSQRDLQQAKEELEQAKKRIEELEKRLGGSPTAKVAESFSVKAEEQRQEACGKKKRKRNKSRRRGRIKTADKVAQAARIEKVFPAGMPEEDCYLSHTRVVWRLENGQAVLVAYEVYRDRKNHYGRIPGGPGTRNIRLPGARAAANSPWRSSWRSPIRSSWWACPSTRSAC